MKKKIYKRLTLISTCALAMLGLASCGKDKEEVKYKVAFNSNDPNTSDTIVPTMYNDIVVKEGEGFELTSYTPTYTGYRFVGWYTNKELTNKYNSGDAINTDTILYAKWQKVCTVTFDSNGGSSVASITCDESTTITKPSDPTKTDEDNGNDTVYKYTFAGWYKKDGTAFDFASAITEDIELKAVYTTKLSAKDGYALTTSTIDFTNYDVADKDALISFKTDDEVFEVSADKNKNEIKKRERTWTKGDVSDATLFDGSSLCTGLSGVKLNQFDMLDSKTTKDFTKCYALGGKKEVDSTYTSLASLNVTCAQDGYIIVYAEVSQGLGILNPSDATYTEVQPVEKDDAGKDKVAQYVFNVSAGTYKLYRTDGSGYIFQAEYLSITKNN